MINRIFKEKLHLTNYANKKLSEIDGIETYIDPEESGFIGIAMINVKNKKSDEVANFLSKNNICVRSGIHCAPLAHKKFKTQNSGALRVSFNIYNTEKQVDSMIKILNKYIKN